MRAKIALLVFFAACGSLHAGWELQKSVNVASSAAPVAHIQKTVANDHAVKLDIVLLDSKKHTLRVIDNAAGRDDLAGAMRGNDCLAGVNGGYFHPDRTPLGLVISDGQTLHGFERARLLSGILVVTRERIALLRAGEYKPGREIRQALQAGPFLVDRGKPVRGLNASARADRTVVLADNSGRCALLLCRSVTLAELGEILSNPRIVTELKVSRAMNLDGGSSSGLWVADEPAPFYRAELKTVRNYLAVVPRY
jgi:uncharacterized protein YigE (DUF2233 family)